MKKLTVEEKMIIEDYFREEKLIKAYKKAIQILKSGGNMPGFVRNITEEERDNFIKMQEENIKNADSYRKELLERIGSNLIETMRGEYE